MKKGAILLLFLLSISLAPATMYECPGTLDSQKNELSIYQTRPINGIGIGLLDAEEIPIYRRITAKILLDAKGVSLSNSTSLLQIIELEETEHTLNLTRVLEDSIRIKIDGSEEEIEIGEKEEIDDLIVYVISAEREEEISADIIIGKELIDLSNDGDPQVIREIGDTEYLIWLFSASDTNAIISSDTCSEDFIEKQLETQEPEEVPENNETSENQAQEQPEQQESTGFIEDSGEQETRFIAKIINFFKSLFRQ